MIKDPSIKILLIFLSIFQLHALRLFAGETGKIAGNVVDKQTGESLPGANIIISSLWLGDREIEMERPTGAATNLVGKYFILNIAPGYYNIRTSFMGYKDEIRTKVRVNIDKTTRVDFQLELQAIAGEEVVVTAYKPNKVEIDLTATKQTYDISEVISIAGVTGPLIGLSA